MGCDKSAGYTLLCLHVHVLWGLHAGCSSAHSCRGCLCDDAQGAGADAVTPGDKEGGGPRIYAAQLQISPGCVILCTPGDNDKSMCLSETPKITTGVSYTVGGFLFCVGFLYCVIYGITQPQATPPSQQGSGFRAGHSSVSNSRWGQPTTVLGPTFCCLRNMSDSRPPSRDVTPIKSTTSSGILLDYT